MILMPMFVWLIGYALGVVISVAFGGRVSRHMAVQHAKYVACGLSAMWAYSLLAH